MEDKNNALKENKEKAELDQYMKHSLILRGAAAVGGLIITGIAGYLGAKKKAGK